MFNRGAFLALTLISGLVMNTTYSPLAHADTNAISQLVPFQGRLHNSEGNVVQDGVYDLTFYVYETATGGEFVWSESHTQVSVIHGYVNVLLGGTQGGDFKSSNVDFATQKYLSISIDGGQEMFPRHQLVPTFHAYDANKLGGKDADTYAQITYVNNEINTQSDRVSALESQFTENKSNDADKLDGLNSSDFLLVNGKSVDSDKLDGLDNTFFRNASNLNSGTISTSRLPAATTSVRGATKKNQMSNATNGYFWDKESGFLMQWGYASTTIDSNNTVSFPISFTNVRNVSTTTLDNSSGGMEGAYVMYVTSISNSYFVSNRNDALDSTTLYYYWQAVGYKAP